MIAADEYKFRTQALQSGLADAGIDLAILTDPDSVTYFAGYWNYLGVEFGRPTLVLVPRSGEPAVVTPLMESEMCGNMSWIGDVRPGPTASRGNGPERSSVISRPRATGPSVSRSGPSIRASLCASSR